MRFLVLTVWFLVLLIGSAAFGAAVTAGRYIHDQDASMSEHIAYGVVWGSGALALGCLFLLVVLGAYLEDAKRPAGRKEKPIAEETRESARE